MGTEIWKAKWAEEHNPLFSRYSVWYMIMESVCQSIAKKDGLTLVVANKVPRVFDEHNLYLINLGTELNIVSIEQGIPKVARVIPQ